MDNRTIRKDVLQEAVIVPAIASAMDDKQVYFLFGVLQVEAILKEVSVRPIPFSAPYLEGVAQWRETVLPVICLERYLDLEPVSNSRGNRFLLVRSPVPSGENNGAVRGILRVHPDIQSRFLSGDSVATRFDTDDKLSGLLKGAYDWEDRRILIVDLKRLLSG